MKDTWKNFSALFDLSFRDQVTPRIIRPLYVLGIFTSLFFVIIKIADAFFASEGRGLLALCFSPILLLFYVLITRVICETLYSIYTVATRMQEAQDTIGSKPAVKIGVDVADAEEGAVEL